MAQRIENSRRVIVKGTFIEVVPSNRAPRRRFVTDSMIMDQQEKVWEKVGADVVSEVTDVSTDDDERTAAATDGGNSLDDSDMDAVVLVPPRRGSDVTVAMADDVATPIVTPWMAPMDSVLAPEVAPLDLSAGGGMMFCTGSMAARAVPPPTQQCGVWWPQDTASYSSYMAADQMAWCQNHYFASAAPDSMMSSYQTMPPFHCHPGPRAASSMQSPQSLQGHGVCSEEDRTTVMLRNLPSDCTRSLLRDVLEAEGFTGTFDLVYVPVDFSSQRGLGYAFVNFLNHSGALRCFDHFEGFTRWPVPGDLSKACTVTWSTASQGLAAHVDRYRNSPVMYHTIPDEWKPAIFCSRGQRLAFPGPTKTIPAPKIRQSKSNNSSGAVKCA